MSTLKAVDLQHPSAAAANISLGSTGNVTIPTAGARITGDFSNATVANRIFFQTSTANTFALIGALPSGTGAISGFTAFNNSDPTNASLADVRASSTDVSFRSNISGAGTYLPMTFYTGGSERMRVDTSGNVGIGTSSAGSKLTVTSNTDNVARFTVGNKGIDGTANFQIFTSTAQGTDVGGSIALGGLNGGGGAFDPWAFGVIKGAKENATSGNLAGYLAFATAQSGGTISERARIDASGNFYVSGSGSNTQGTGWAGALTSPVGSISISRNGSNVLAFFHTSNASGIGGSPVGTVSITTTATTYSTSSDYRLKNSVAPMTTGLATVSALKPVIYKWNVDDSDGEGFIAHELQSVIPHAVTGEKDAVDEDGKPIHQGVDYSKIVVHLVAALQEAVAKIDTLEARIATLEAK